MRPNCSAATIVVPEPRNGSQIVPVVQLPNNNLTQSIGFSCECNPSAWRAVNCNWNKSDKCFPRGSGWNVYFPLVFWTWWDSPLSPKWAPLKSYLSIAPYQKHNFWRYNGRLGVYQLVTQSQTNIHVGGPNRLIVWCARLPSVNTNADENSGIINPSILQSGSQISVPSLV